MHLFIRPIILIFNLKAAYSVTMNIFRKKNIFFLNHLQKENKVMLSQ